MANPMKSLAQLFGRSQSNIIGVIHVGALPGTPRNTKSISEVIDMACEEAEIYKKAGVDGIIVENMHDVPYLHTKDVGHEITAFMTAICSRVNQMCSHIPCGVQILSGANIQAMAVAKATGLQFIRAEGFVFSHVADEGIMDSCAAELLRFRKNIDADDIKIFTDVKKKHSSHAITADVDITETAKAAEFFCSDGVIVTGPATGTATDIQEMKDVQKAVNVPLLIGSGVTVDNVEHYMSANGLIVGSHFKDQGSWKNRVDFTRVRKMVEKVNTMREVGNMNKTQSFMFTRGAFICSYLVEKTTDHRRQF
ncbi:uncharacterized protein F13E9.13, mitochondrial-like [Ptychodera flava]|uniref:uncharacterized protein F13E9.13, mitochondrial-like n=1 Tax=Ptychodera flava TaxID=63121 RepID=UPI003969E0FC